jgi:hypothetical protein
MKHLIAALIALTTPAMAQDQTCVRKEEFMDAIPKADALARRLDELSQLAMISANDKVVLRNSAELMRISTRICHYLPVPVKTRQWF